VTARQLYDRLKVPAAIALALAAAAGIFATVASTEWADYSTITLGRYQRAQRAGTIEIATVWRRDGDVVDPSLTIGAGVAAAEVNAGGGVNVNPPPKRQLKIHVTSYDVEISNETKMARAIARDTHFVAVIGHTTSDTANISAISYQQTNLLFIAVNDTDPVLTTHDGFDYIFRTSPTDTDVNDLFAMTLKAVAPPQPGRIGVLYARSAHFVMTPYLNSLGTSLLEQSLTPSFEKPYAISLFPPGKGLLARLSGGHFGSGPEWLTYLRASDQLRDTASRIYEDDTPLDGLIILDDNPNNAAKVIDRIRTTMPAGERTIVIGGPGVDSGEQPQAADCFDLSLLSDSQRLQASVKAGSLLVVTPLCQVTPALSAEMAKFDAELKKRPKGTPFNHNIAWQGYRAVKILAEAMSNADSIAPADVAAQLRSGTPFQSAGGASFKRNGDLMFRTSGDQKEQTPNEETLYVKLIPPPLAPAKPRR
jgi:ABC-type branched-subunit amino acid transport system substrate-binding protein